jgi:tetratricopeptide (TPR) repeat protein
MEISLTTLKKAGNRIYMILFLALFFCTCAVWKERPQKLRLAMLPASVEQWAIADRIIDRLAFEPDTLVYPPAWIWEAIEPDSVSDENYLKRFSRRIQLDAAVLFDYRPGLNSYIWRLYDVRTDDIRIADTVLVSATHDNISAVADTVAFTLLEYYQQPAHNHGLSISQADISYKLAQSQKKLLQEEYQQALAYGQALFQADSMAPVIRNHLAQVHMQYGIHLENEGKAGRYHQLRALKLCERTIYGIDSTQSEAYRIAARFYLLDEMWGRAESYLRKARELDVNNAAVYLDFAHLHKNRIKRLGFKNVESLIEHALWLNPCFEEARLYLADYLFFNGWRQDAIDEIEKLLYIHPRSIQGWLFLGKFSVIKGDLQQIIEIYNHILEIDPQNADAYYNLGVYYYNSGDYQNAERFFNKAITLNNHLNSHLYLGYLYETRGEIEKAIKEYRLRIRYKKGKKDKFVDQARKRLFALTKPDTSELNIEIKINP